MCLAIAEEMQTLYIKRYTFHTFNSNISHVKKVADYPGFSLVNQTTYYKIHCSMVVPTIHEHYAMNIAQARKEAQDTNIVVLADALFDSPGKYVKYCTYSLQTPITKILLPLSLFKKIVAKDQHHLN